MPHFSVVNLDRQANVLTGPRSRPKKGVFTLERLTITGTTPFLATHRHSVYHAPDRLLDKRFFTTPRRVVIDSQSADTFVTASSTATDEFHMNDEAHP